MMPDYFAILGLAPGVYGRREVAQRFQAARAALLRELYVPARAADARRRLDQLHLAYATLREPEQQKAYLRIRRAPDNATDELRAMIEAALEDGLLRYSRRQEILARARELGIGEFQAQLLMAQTQFGDEGSPLPVLEGERRSRDSRAWPRVAAVGMLALAMFLALVAWVKV